MDDRYPMDTGTLKYWLALVRIPSLGSIRIHRLLDRFDTPEAIFREAGRPNVTIGVSDSVKNALRNPPWNEVDRDLKWLEQPNHHLVTLPEPIHAFPDD